jgi:hypothetical protein
MPQSSQTFRIFVSSTFSDLVAERNALQERTFPRLRQLAQQHGARFQVIDLRWGVSEEASLDQQAMAICLGEVARCQQTSPRPNFIVLLGDRYGWCPPPSYIPDDEFRRLRNEIANEADRSLVEAWYSLDQNAVPPRWLLKPRQRGGPYENYAGWQPVETHLQAVLAEAAKSLTLTEDRLLAYTASATEQEIYAGAMQAEDAPEHVACFLRSIEGLPQQFDPAARDYVDLDEKKKAVDEGAHRKQTSLKKRLADRVPGNVHTYAAHWIGGGVNSVSGITTDHVDRLCDDVYNFLARIIQAEIEQPHAAPPAAAVTVHLRQELALDDEVRLHHQFAEERLRFFVGRTEVLAKISSYLHSNSHRSLAITGAGGTGKSALLAKAIEQAQVALPNAQVVFRFIGATPGSSDGRSLLESLCREIARRYGANETDIPLDYRDLVPELGKRMQLATADKPLVVFLDSLDQLSASQGARSLVWLPGELPEHVRLVASSRDEDTLSALQVKQAQVEELVGLSRSDGEDLLSQWLESVQRTLQPGQRQAVLESFAQSLGNPLYLKLAFEEARLWVSGDGKPPENLALEVSGMIKNNMIARLAKEGNHGEVLVSRALGYLAASRYGLAEDELVDLLSRDPDVYAWFLTNSYHFPADILKAAMLYLERQPASEDAALDWLKETRKDAGQLRQFLEKVLPAAAGPRLPVVLWSRLSFDLAPILTERLVDGSPLLSFYHRELGDVAKAIFLGEAKEPSYHARLADYFRSKADPGGDRIWTGGDRHGLSDLPYHLVKSKRWEEVYQTLTDFKFLEHKAAEVGVLESKDAQGKSVKTYSGVLQLQEDYELALAAMPGGEDGLGDRAPLILTALETSKGLMVYCPVCNKASPIQKEQLDMVIHCPQENCSARIKLNLFTVKREI